jgi:DNA-binding CsgD family transcriptional regulator
MEMACALCLLVEAHVAAGNSAAAAAAAGRLAQLASSSGAGLAVAHAALARGRVAAAEAGSEAAVRCFEEALARFAQLEMPLEAARARLELARALVLEQLDLAITEARAALSALDRLGASADADIAAAQLRSWGATGRAVPRQAGPLTRREQEILVLLARGLSNQEIAEQLYVSRKTVAHHVSSLLAKLGVRNRAEAASFATRNLGAIRD